MTNSAIIVFREGLEAVLILAALMASLVGAQRRYRRPLLAGVGVALLAVILCIAAAARYLPPPHEDTHADAALPHL